MNKLVPIEHKNQRVLTTAQIADGYGTDEKRISENFNRNKDRYIEGKHYYALSGESKTQFCNHTQIADGSKKAHMLYLWTEKGALFHAKSLNTDKAWEVYDHLVETYFCARDMFTIPKTLPEALRYAAELAEKIEQDKPKVIFAETCLKSTDSILIRELAKIAKHDGIDTGEHKLYTKLKKWGLLMPNNEPYQRYINAGYFEVTEKPYDTEYGVKLARTTKVLPRGQAYIINRLKREA